MQTTKIRYYALLVALLIFVSVLCCSCGANNGAAVVVATAKVVQSTAVLTEIPTPAPTDSEAWLLILVNKDNPLPENWSIELTYLSNGQTVDSRIYPDLQEMFDSMRADGVYPVVASGYRTYEKQQSLMDERIDMYLETGCTMEEARAAAEEWVALPGTSEHQLGIAVDINADGVNSEGAQVYEWLAKHAYKFGFILRYPEDKIEITGISNEPWHYRYVGREYARLIFESGMCLEEYLESMA